MVSNGDNNGNYTPPIYGDPRGSLGTGGMGWSEPKSVVMSMPPTRPGAITSQVELQGDIKAAGAYIPLVRQQMQAMHQQNISNLEIMDRPVNLGDGKMMLCQRRFNADRAIIHVPEKGVSKGPFHLNFDADSVRDFKSGFAYDKFYGLPLHYPDDDCWNTGTSSGLSLEYGEFGPAGKSSYGIQAVCESSSYWGSDADRGVYGLLQHSASWDGPKTFGLVYNVNGGNGFAYINKTVVWRECNFNIDLNFWVKGNVPAGNTHLYIHQLSPSIMPKLAGIILARVKPIEVSYSDPGYGVIVLYFRAAVDLFIDGKQAIDGGEISGTTGLGDGHMILSSLRARAQQQYNSQTELFDGTTTQVGLCQFFAYNTLATNDDVQRTTDKLAARWGL